MEGWIARAIRDSGAEAPTFIATHWRAALTIARREALAQAAGVAEQEAERIKHTSHRDGLGMGDELREGVARVIAAAIRALPPAAPTSSTEPALCLGCGLREDEVSRLVPCAASGTSHGWEAAPASPGAEDLEAMAARIAKAHVVVSDLCQGRATWRMSVPAREDQDPDLVISAALRDADSLLAACRAARRGEGGA